MQNYSDKFKTATVEKISLERILIPEKDAKFYSQKLKCLPAPLQPHRNPPSGESQVLVNQVLIEVSDAEEQVGSRAHFPFQFEVDIVLGIERSV